MRYTFFRAHKYVSAKLHELEKLAALSDFRNKKELNHLNEQFKTLKQMLHFHGMAENEMLFVLLKENNFPLKYHLEEEHDSLEKQGNDLEEMLNKALECADAEQLADMGYQFYLEYRKFVGDNLLHLHEEETIFLPELHKLYSDEQLRSLVFATYKEMSSEQIIEMIETLFPHMNASDRESELKDIKEGVPDKFLITWDKIKSMLDPFEQEQVVCM